MFVSLCVNIFSIIDFSRTTGLDRIWKFVTRLGNDKLHCVLEELQQIVIIPLIGPFCFLLNAKTKPQISCPADQHLCIRFMDSTIPLLSKSEISSL